MNEIGKFIKEERKKNSLSQRSLAEKAGISNTELWKIENGERVNPNPKTLNALAMALNISPKILLEKANYIDSSTQPLNTMVSSIPFSIKRQHYIKLEKILSHKIIDELSKKYRDRLDSQTNYKIGYKSQIDTVCFSKSGDVIAIDYNFIVGNPHTISNPSFFMNQIQRRIKSTVADFYFYFKKLATNDDNLKFLCIFILNDSIDKAFFIDSINAIFRNYQPFFEYKLFYESEIL